MNKELLKKFFFGDNLLIVIVGILISFLLIGFLIFGLSDPKSTMISSSPSLVEIQDTYENNFLIESNSDEFVEENPYFILDPYKISPLSGLILFSSEEYKTYKIIVKGKTEEADIEYTNYGGVKHYIPVYGLYAGYINTVELYEVISGEDDILVKTLLIQTAELPSEVALPSLIETTYEYFGDDLMMVMPAINTLPSAYDFNGDVRWYLSTNLSWAPAMLENGHLLLGTNEIISDPYYTTGLYEIDYLGKIYTEFMIPGGYHHDVYEMDNGNLLIGTSNFDGTVEDIIIEVERTSGDILKTWNLADYLPELDGMAEMWTTYDWFHNNSIFYDEDTDSIILSGRHQDVVISIGYTSSELNWILGDPENWGVNMVSEYFFTPVGSDFEWQYAQHSAIVLEDGNIFLFDNGNNRSKYRETDIPAYNNYSRGVIYDIDTDNMTIKQVYQFGKELGPEFYSPYISNVAYYADGHYLIHSGGHSEIDGQNINVPAPLSEDFLDADLNSITIEVLNDEVMYRLELSNNYYRAKKITLYTINTGIIFGLAERLGSQLATDLSSDKIDTRFNFFDTAPTKYEIDLFKENDRLVFKGAFDKNEIIYLLLENDQEELLYYVPTGSNTFTAMCIAVFDGDDTYVTFHINEENVSGVFKVYLYVDGHKYFTYKTVEFK